MSAKVVMAGFEIEVLRVLLPELELETEDRNEASVKGTVEFETVFGVEFKVLESDTGVEIEGDGIEGTSKLLTLEAVTPGGRAGCLREANRNMVGYLSRDCAVQGKTKRNKRVTTSWQFEFGEENASVNQNSATSHDDVALFAVRKSFVCDFDMCNLQFVFGEENRVTTPGQALREDCLRGQVELVASLKRCQKQDYHLVRRLLRIVGLFAGMGTCGTWRDIVRDAKTVLRDDISSAQPP
ncbi:hypothetical protein DdX_14120 [Ditylenchus destructor]|uniref:Uncharacterized protein n=1 Tax=Ditylenchus destructor TaxID=166010 RepID=A0AAD4MSD2_9BILA|nr:hypothetical protein DdX_14120 [Ditylenchus destructor]